LAGPLGGGAAHYPVKRCTTLRRYVVGRPGALLQLGLVASCIGSCAPTARYQQPSALRGYEILITRSDSLGQGIARGLRRLGYKVRDEVVGGGRPTAYVLTFTFRETEPPTVTWLHVRLADTRTGAIVAAVSAPVDSLGASAAERAQAVVDSLAASPALKAPKSSP
jgi:hypothetical protein